jgi:hypothetical protein
VIFATGPAAIATPATMRKDSIAALRASLENIFILLADQLG